MKRCDLPKRTLTLWQIRISMISVVVLAAVSFLFFASVWFLLLTAVFAVIFLAAVFWYLPAYFKSYTIEYSEDTVIINRGVFIKTTHIMPFSRLIYSESLSTPLSKRFGLSALTLKAARRVLIIPEMRDSDVKQFIISATKGEKP